MTIDERITAAVTPVVPEVAPQIYERRALTYCTYNYTEMPQLHSSGKPRRITHLCQLHLMLPLGAASVTLRRELCRALWHAGFTWPQITDAYDGDGQHWVFEFEGKEALGDG